MSSLSPSDVLLGVTLATLVWVFYCAVWRLYLSPLSKYPGPPLAALTLWYEFYYDIVKNGGGQYIWEIERLHKKHGPIVRINPYELHIDDPEFYLKIYAGNNRRRDKYPWQTKSGNSAQAMGFSIEHNLHSLRRKALDPYFSKRSVSDLEPMIKLKTSRLCQRIEEYHNAHRPINLTNAFLAMTMDVITEYAFCDCYNLLDDEEFNVLWGETITSVMKSTALINHFGWLPRLVKACPPRLLQFVAPDMSLVVEYKKRIKSQVQRIIDDRGADYDTDKGRKTIFEELQDSEHLPPQEKLLHRLTDEGAILLIAASETPAKVLSLIFFHLITNPSILDKLRSELKSILTGAITLPSLAQLEQLPYLTAVINEGLRLHNGITARSARIAPTEALRYNDWAIPAGTPVSSISVFTHYNPDIFPQPKAFKPERWLGVKSQRLGRYLIAFGRGSRNCLGTNLAIAELFITVAAVVQRFEMRLFETDLGDVELQRDWYVPHARLGSSGVRALVVRQCRD